MPKSKSRNNNRLQQQQSSMAKQMQTMMANPKFMDMMEKSSSSMEKLNPETLEKFSSMMDMEKMSGILNNDALPQMMEAISPMMKVGSDILPVIMPVISKLIPKITDALTTYVKDGKSIDQLTPDEALEWIHEYNVKGHKDENKAIEL